MYSFLPLEARTWDSPGFRLWYLTEGDQAFASEARSRQQSSVEASLKQASQIAESALTLYRQLGFREPVGDAAGACNVNGGDGRVDAYFVKLGGADGATQLDECVTGTKGATASVCSGFVVVDHAFERYESFEIGVRTVLPHELFHLVQAAYDHPLADFWSEGTAQWAAKQANPGLRDMESYFPAYLKNVERPIDLPPATAAQPFSYGAALFVQFLSEAYDREIVRDVFERMSAENSEAKPRTDELTALELVLRDRGSSLQDAFVLFTIWNTGTGSRAGMGGYAEAATYPLLPILRKLSVNVMQDGGTAGLSANYFEVAEDGQFVLNFECNSLRTRASFVPLRAGVAEVNQVQALPGVVTGPGIVVVTGLSRDKKDSPYKITLQQVTASAVGTVGSSALLTPAVGTGTAGGGVNEEDVNTGRPLAPESCSVSPTAARQREARSSADLRFALLLGGLASILRITPQSWRRIALLLHRYVGLFLVIFLVVAGVTGSVLAFYRPLDELLNSELYQLPEQERSQPLSDPFELAEKVEHGLSAGAHYRTVRFDAEVGRSLAVWVEAQPGQWQEWFISPKSGRVMGTRAFGDSPLQKRNLMPFVYSLHYSLALGVTGSLLFGVAALLWTLDCFVGAYLTLPQTSPGARRRSPLQFLRSWLPAWTFRTNRLFSWVFTWHRASGLWIWALLFVFAWSAVGFNLRPVYAPVMQTLVGMQPEGHELLPELTPPFAEPALSLRQAYQRGKVEMAREQNKRGFQLKREVSLYYAADHGAYSYVVESSLDISKAAPRTEVFIDGQTGRYLGFSAPTGISFGNTVSSWFFALHTGAAFGLWYRILVVLVGVFITVLSVTGVWIWWRKREKSKSAAVGVSPRVARAAGVSPRTSAGAASE